MEEKISSVKEIHKCRVCGNNNLVEVIDLGNQFLASIFPKLDDNENNHLKFPLKLVKCSNDGGCGLVQLKHSVSPDILYDDYGYRSGINESMRENLKDITKKAVELVQLNSNDTVLDIGCNDGTLLCSYQRDDINKIGIDPAKNVVDIAKHIGLNVINDYFSARLFRKNPLPNKPKIITSIAMFYDLEQPCTFAKDVAEILADDGIWVIEMSYLPFMLQKNSFDTICHEHLEYYAFKQLEYIMSSANLFVWKTEFNEINGGSIRLFVTKDKSKIGKDDLEALQKIRNDEISLLYESENQFVLFNKTVQELRDKLKTLIDHVNQEGKKIYLYGASTKGNTILQYCGIDSSHINKAADRNPEKWGRKTLGSDIEIISEEQARAEKPDYFMALPWSFINHFMNREIDFLKQGGKFIVPLPEVRILGINDLP